MCSAQLGGCFLAPRTVLLQRDAIVGHAEAIRTQSRKPRTVWLACVGRLAFLVHVCYNRQGRKANVGAGTATATEPTPEHRQYATQGPTTYLCT